MKKTVLAVLSAICFHTISPAQNNELLNLSIEARVDYMQEYREGNKINDNSGLKGRYLNIRMDGTLAEGFTYSYRQRLNKPNKDISFFDATDWITVTYTRNNWSFSTGKQVVGIGGYEYDIAPIDLHIYSEFWGNIPCFKVGVSSTYTTDDQKDKFMFQFCESPFRGNEHNIGNKEMFAYNAVWYGSHGLFSSIWSVNMMEYLPGRFINYIALGNKFTIGNFSAEIDIMNKALSVKEFLGKDMSFMCRFLWTPTDYLNVFANVTHDYNNYDMEGDWTVLPGTSVTRVGGGLEYFPIKNSKDLRLHMSYCYTDGVNTSPAGALYPKQNIFDIGITWRMKLLKIKR
jgi:hypothetical protein